MYTQGIPKEETGLNNDNEGYGFEGAKDMCKGESGYHAYRADILNCSCDLLFPDICPPGGDLEFLEEAHEEGKRDNLLEYGWGNSNNIQDMDKLFSCNDSMLSQSFDNNTDGMLWDPPSPTLGESLGSVQHSVKVPVSSEFILRSDMDGVETKPDTSTSKIAARFAEPKTDLDPREMSVLAQTSSLEASGLPMDVNEDYTKCSKENLWESQGTCDGGHCRGLKYETTDGFKEASKGKAMHVDVSLTDNDSTHAFKGGEKWKTNKARRHGPRSRKLEENSRKSVSGRKMALNLTPKSPLVYIPFVSTMQDSPPFSTTTSQITRAGTREPTSPLQCLQAVPYFHAGFGFSAHHHMSVVSPSVVPQQLQSQAQPVFIGYQPPFIDVPKLQQIKSTFEAFSRSPTASSTMTPQEKIEKLRWRQKMQARLAVEKQQQKLINQCLVPERTQFEKQYKHQNCPQSNTPEEASSGSDRLAYSQCAEPSVWKEISISTEGATVEDGDESLAAIVLQQLLNIASKMDTRMRLCLSDGFRRLAGNAMQRRAGGDNRGIERSNTKPFKGSCVAESSSSSEQSFSKRLLTVEDIVETETNPMDRFIAHLLFHKRFPSSFVPSYMNCNPCTISENFQPALLYQTEWAWQETNPSSGVSPAIQSSSVNSDFGPSKGQNVILDVTKSTSVCEKPSVCLSSTIISSLQLEHIPATSAANSLPHSLERESDMIEMDTFLPPVVTTQGNFGEVEDPLQ